MSKLLNWLGVTVTDADKRLKQIPAYYADDALLILVKSLVTEVQRLIEESAKYAPESTVRKDLRGYAAITYNVACEIAEAAKTLMNTPLGNQSMHEAIGIALAQLDAALAAGEENI